MTGLFMMGGLLILAGCGSDDDSSSDAALESSVPSDGGAESPSPPADATDDDPAAEPAPPPPAADAEGSGQATLTIGDETWEFEGFVCAVGYANTESDLFSLSTNAFGVHSDGTRLQMQASIDDDSGQDRLSGEGLGHTVSLDDIEDFENPVVSWEMIADSGITLDGTSLTAEGTFRDFGTGAEAPGRLDADCGPGSRM
ncbi:MAG: hypothetical protein HKN26_04490 [Acidimicrobiales bacterium]|nr:hypothetical protein [Acidimicrobiales bacterium]